MSKRMIGLVLVLAALCVGMTAQAGTARGAMRKQMESSLLLNGTITVAQDGSVIAHTLDSTEALGDTLTKFVNGSIDKWRFEPVVIDGKVVTAKVPMSLRLVATPRDDGKSDVRIASTHFGSSEILPATASVQPRDRMEPPQYPYYSRSFGAMGTVYLIVQVGHDGAVVNVDAEQVNLKVIGAAYKMELLRKDFSDAAISAVRRWQFKPPTTGPSANKASWLVRVAVEFVLHSEGEKPRKDGNWESYVPGPRNMNMPWAREELQTAGSPDALSEGSLSDLQQGAKLLNPPAA